MSPLRMQAFLGGLHEANSGWADYATAGVSKLWQADYDVGEVNAQAVTFSHPHGQQCVREYPAPTLGRRETFRHGREQKPGL